MLHDDVGASGNFHPVGAVVADVLEEVVLALDTKTPKDKWNRIYSNRSGAGSPAYVLTEFHDLLPRSGHALDIACGLGANARFLNDRGFIVDAWDISDVAIDQLRSDVPDIEAQVKDITTDVFPSGKYDLIVNCHYFDREIINAMKGALTPGGLIAFQTFTQNKLVEIGPSNPDFLLAPNELPTLFSDLETLIYLDASDNQDVDHPLAGRACLIARMS